jgi:cholesterol transport system auxiliary component
MRPWSTTSICTCLTLIVASTAGCLDLKKSYPEKRSFVLDVGEPQREARENGTIVVKINKLRVSPLFAGRAMVYRIADLQYESDFYNEWFVAPAALVTQQVHHWLSQISGFQLVGLGMNHLDPTHLLQGTVTEFYGDFRDTPLAVLGLDVHVLDAMHAHQPLFRRSYHQEVPLGDRSPDALARGLTEALRLALVDMAKDLALVEPHRQRH